MRNTTTSLLSVASLLLTTLAQGEIIAAWTPTANGGPRGDAYGSSTTIVSADTKSPGVLWTSAQRVELGNWINDGAVWSGSLENLGFSDFNYTRFSLEIAEGSTIELDSFTFNNNFYGTERETVEGGEVLSTIQARIRSSLDDFASDLAATSSGPTDRTAANNVPFVFDLSDIEAMDEVTGPIEFRVYFWEESTAPGFDPFMWNDLATDGAVFEGSVLTANNREVLAAWIPTPAPEGAANSTGVEPSKVVLAPEVTSASASNVGKGGGTNAAAVWPSSVNSLGLDEAIYLETTVVPAPGSIINLTDYVINQINTYGTTGPDGWAAALRTSLDGFAENVATAEGTDDFEIAMDLTGEAGLQNLGAPITLRFYIWDVEPGGGAGHDPFMWTDIVGSSLYSNESGIQIIGTTGVGSLQPPSIEATAFLPETGFVVEVVNVTPGRTYDLFLTFDLAEPFTALEIEKTAVETELTFTDTFANPSLDPRAFYVVKEVGRR